MTSIRHASRLVAATAVLAALTLAACSTDESIAGDDPAIVPASEPAGESQASDVPAQYPVTVSSCGRDNTFEQAPDRVVLGYPRTLETLEALGVGDAAYGYALGSYDKLPKGYPSDIVEVSPDYIPAREAILGAQPNLLLANDEAQITGEGGVTYEGLEASGSATYILGGYCSDAPAPTSLDVVLEDVANLGRIFGVEERATEVVTDLKSRIEAARGLGEGQDLSVA